MQKYKPTFSLILFLVIGWLVMQTSFVQADDVVVKLTLHPSPLPVPAMKYRLMPAADKLDNDNASNHYRRVLSFTANSKERYQKHVDLADLSLDELRKEKCKNIFDQLSFDEIFYELEKASRCNHCDWQIPYERFHVKTNLNDLQEMRQIARLLVSKLRWEIAQKRYDDALNTALSGIMLSRNLSNNHVISSLIGYAVFSIAHKQLEEFITQPDSPNLYWAYSEIPKFTGALRFSADIEKSFLLYAVPSFNNINKKVFTRFEAKQLETEYLNFYKLHQGSILSNDTLRLKFTLWILKIYPDSVKTLEKYGYQKKTINQMQTVQVVILSEYLFATEMQDRFSSSLFLNPKEALNRFKQTSSLMKNNRNQHSYSEFDLSNFMGESFQYVYYAALNQDRKIAEFRTIELLRDYLSKHNQFPTSIDQLDSNLIPFDPATGKPFLYKSDGVKATLKIEEAIPVSNRFYKRVYELSIAK
jgi:hypothetical protein